jgi:lipid-A-disaccharide synthase
VGSSADGDPRAATVGIVAGEASGDLLGAELMRALRAIAPDVRFTGIGGPRMEAVGMEVLYPLQKLAVRGYVEVLKHYREILRIRRHVRDHFIAAPPAVFVGIDAPDFNLDLELALKAQRIPTVHYVSPSIWAWRSKRIHKIKRAVDKMLTVFPFEPAIYEAAGVPVEYVGHPLADMIDQVPGRREMREQLKLPLAAPVIALLPGSRQSELAQLATLYAQTARQITARLPQAIFLAPLVSRETREIFEAALYQGESSPLNLTILFGHAHEALAAADVALVASGTATLEAALLRCPHVITYKMPASTYWLMRRHKRLPYVGLPNILAGEFVAPEILQKDATADNLAQALLNLLHDPTVRDRIELRFAALHASLRNNASHRAASALLPYLHA